MKIDHFGLAVKDIEKALNYYCEFLNYSQVTPIVEDLHQKVRVVMLKQQFDDKNVGFELISPLTENSPIDNYLQKKDQLYQIAYEVDDIEASLKRARKFGCIILGKPTPSPLFEGRHVAFVYSPDNFVIEFVSAS